MSTTQTVPRQAASAGSADLDRALAPLVAAAEDPQGYAEAWKREQGRMAIGSFPMNFPGELVHAAGALPVIIQESREPITEGRNLLFEFYCGYTRSIADQAAKRQFDVFDGFVLADQCIQLQGAVDVLQTKMPDKPVRIGQFIASLDESWTHGQVDETILSLKSQMESLTGESISAEALSSSIRLFNSNRRLLREVYDLRRDGRSSITARQMQMLVKSSMVMDKAEHSAILADIIPLLSEQAAASPQRVRLHLSGHFCHAPRPELLDLIEDCGAVVVDDDLYTGYRYISTDVPEDSDPLNALSHWYLDRNVSVPCPTRAQNTVDWDDYLLRSLKQSGAAGVIILMAKFCEPHMLYYPELRKALNAHEISYLLIETEHEGLPEESIRTKVETLIERIRRGRMPAAVPV
jgi:bcr-type benzoyl-CoA reductase subunit C